MGPFCSSTLTFSTGSPQHCVLSPLLYALHTYDCTPIHSTNTIIKFADDSTVVGLKTRGDESANREEVQRLAEWCSVNNLVLNTSKTKEMVVDIRRHKVDPAPLYINRDCVERVSSFKFLGTHITEDSTWTANTTAVVKKALQRLHFWRVLQRTWRRSCWWPSTAPPSRAYWHTASHYGTPAAQQETGELCRG